MTSSSAYALPRERNLILASLLVLAAAAWAVLVWQAGDTGTMGTGPTMGLGAPLFLAIWVVMMVAMMFPTTAPMILTFARVQAGKRQRGEAKADQAAQFHHPIFAVVESVAPLLSTQFTFSSSPFLPPLKANLT